MKSLTIKWCVISLLIFKSSFLPDKALAARYFVKVNGSDVNTGLSWTQAYETVQKALSVSGSGDEIWVAAGTYYPDEGASAVNDSRSESFKLVAGVSLFGGFVGGETLLSQRDVLMNETILSGEIQQDNDRTNNSHHILYCGPGIGNNTRLNGFTVRDGYSGEIATDTPDAAGAGIRIVNSSPKITYCHFTENIAGRGGGMSIDSSAMPEINFCKFSLDSTVYSGGAVYNKSSSPIFTSCIFQGNTTNAGGGAVYNKEATSSNYINCLFAGNYSNNGGGMFNESSNSLIVNGTFAGNQSFGGGGAIYNLESSPNVFNTIAWDNRASGVTNSLNSVTFNFSNSNPSFNHCILSAAFDINGTWQTDMGMDGGFNLMADPLFNSSLDPVMAPDTGGNFHLDECSPAINSGDNSINLTMIDAAGAIRTNEGTIDLGAFELVSLITNSWTGLGDGIHWTDPMNWINQAVPTNCQHVQIPDGSTVVLGGLEQGFGKTLEVDENADFQVDQTAELSVINN